MRLPKKKQFTIRMSEKFFAEGPTNPGKNVTVANDVSKQKKYRRRINKICP